MAELEPLLAQALADGQPALLFAPQGLIRHVDHRRLMQAVRAAAPSCPTFWYRDTPYIIRQPDAAPAPELPAGLVEVAVPLSAAAVHAKVAASQSYVSQIQFQFGGPEATQEKLIALAGAEARTAGLRGGVERFAVEPGYVAHLPAVFAMVAMP